MGKSDLPPVGRSYRPETTVSIDSSDGDWIMGYQALK
jgi:hypothetical protein